MARPRARIDTEALVDAFSHDGLHGTSADALAAAIGVAKPTLYAHGGSKEELFVRAVEAEVERVVEAVQRADAATAGRSARTRAVAVCEALLAHAAARPLGARLIHRTARHGGSAVAISVAAALRRPPDRIEAMMRRDLAADGLDPHDAPFIARALYGAVVAVSEVRGGERRPSRQALADMVGAIVPEAPALSPEDWPAA